MSRCSKRRLGRMDDVSLCCRHFSFILFSSSPSRSLEFYFDKHLSTRSCIQSSVSGRTTPKTSLSLIDQSVTLTVMYVRNHFTNFAKRQSLMKAKKQNKLFLTLHKFIDFFNRNPWLWLVWMSCAGFDIFFFLADFSSETRKYWLRGKDIFQWTMIGGHFQKFLHVSINKEAPRPRGTIVRIFLIESLWHEHTVTYTMDSP